MAAQFDRLPSGANTEERFGKKVISSVGHVGFDVTNFTHMMCVNGGYAMQGRLLALAKGIIRSYAMQHDAGIQTEHTREAKRIHKVSK